MDAVVDQLIRNIFSRAKDVDEREFIKKQVASTSAQYQRQLTKAKSGHGKAVQEISKWEDLMLDSIEGSCVFTPEQVKKRMIAAHIIKSVTLSRGYDIQVEFNISEAQYLNGMELS